MASTERTRVARPARPDVRGRGRARRQVLALTVSAALALSACSSADEDATGAGTEAGAPPGGAVTGAPVSGQVTSGQAGASDEAAEARRNSVDDRPVDSTPTETSEDSEARTTPDAAPPPPGSPAGSTEDELLPPGFASVNSVLMEDAFNGPDLELAAVDISSGEDIHRVVFHLEGAGFPGWEVAYPDAPETDPETSPSSLQITLIGVDAAAAALELPTSSALQLDTARPVEGDLSMVLHVDQPAAPFRVHLQHDPLRVVVEVTLSA